MQWVVALFRVRCVRYERADPFATSDLVGLTREQLTAIARDAQRQRAGVTRGEELAALVVELAQQRVVPAAERHGRRAGGRGELRLGVAVGVCVCVFRSGLAFGGVRVRCLCVRCSVPGVSAVACLSSRVSCPGVEI